MLRYILVQGMNVQVVNCPCIQGGWMFMYTCGFNVHVYTFVGV